MVLPFDSVDPADPPAPADDPPDDPPELCASAQEQAARLMPKAKQMTFIETSKNAPTRPLIPQTDRDNRMAAITFLPAGTK
jgi:hypothetical protein